LYPCCDPVTAWFPASTSGWTFGVAGTIKPQCPAAGCNRLATPSTGSLTAKTKKCTQALGDCQVDRQPRSLVAQGHPAARPEANAAEAGGPAATPPTHPSTAVFTSSALGLDDQIVCGASANEAPTSADRKSNVRGRAPR
jgi:hypothetical protein